MTTTAVTTFVKNKIELKVPLAVGTLQWGTTWIDDKVINSGGVLTEKHVCPDCGHFFYKRRDSV